MKKKEWKYAYKELAKDAKEMVCVMENMGLENVCLNERLKELEDENEYLHSQLAKSLEEMEDFRKCVVALKKDAVRFVQKELRKDEPLVIENIEWENDENKKTTVTWSDGTTTTVSRQKGEKYDKQAAVSYAIAKKLLKNTSVADVVEYYSEDHSKDEKYARIYKALNSKSSHNRIRAQKAWEKISEAKRRSIKAMVNR
jgi:hypothetical protein